MTDRASLFPSWKRALWTAALIVCATALLNIMAASRLHTYRELTQTSERVIDRVTTLRGHLLNVETGQRGYLLVGEQPYLVPYRNAVGSVAGDLDSLEAYARAGRIEQGEIARLSQLSREKLHELDTTITLKSAGHTDLALGIVRSDHGRVLMDSAREIIQLLITRERLNLAEHQAVEERWSNIVLIVVLLGTALTLGVLVYLHGALNRYDAEQRAAARELERQMQFLEELARARAADASPNGGPTA
jgi:CHASE3 domain sensor protein